MFHEFDKGFALLTFITVPIFGTDQGRSFELGKNVW